MEIVKIIFYIALSILMLCCGMYALMSGIRYLKYGDDDEKEIDIVYHSKDFGHGLNRDASLKKIKVGDWIDLYSVQNATLKRGEFALIDLGVSMKLPEGYEAHVVPRSSTFKNWGILQANSMGIIDNSYSGTNDVWKFPAYATRNTKINIGDRICQFRIVKSQPQLHFNTKDKLDDVDRGGFGTTGKA